MDIFGKALADYYKTGKAETLWLYNSYDEVEEMPVDIFFRTKKEMPGLELLALDLCRGEILDIGAGVGSHALLLQDMGKDVTALDISGTAVKIMQQRGVKKTIAGDINNIKERQFDTLLFLMNGIGLTGTLPGFIDFLNYSRSLLKPGGQMLFDSSDISYLYQGEITLPLNRYFGEVRYCYEYKKQKGSWFNWLYIDQRTLKETAAKQDWNCEILLDDGHDQFLAKMKPV